MPLRELRRSAQRAPGSGILQSVSERVRPAFLCQRRILHRRAADGRAVAGLDVGDVMRAPGGHGGKRTRRRLRGRCAFLNGGGGRIRRGGLLPALLGLTVQIVGGDDGGRGLWLAGAKQRIGRDAFWHADHSSFRGRRTRERAALLSAYDSPREMRQIKVPSASFSRKWD